MLVILFGAIGLASIVGYPDYVLLPSLALFIGVTSYAFIKSSPT
ncbi:MAG: hypothetical protein COC05_01960 [Gammaproteobacteria bacterium]|nr:MAG: hypothetical protein COC05_01960 [Gammaproteobacteria bacterium]